MNDLYVFAIGGSGERVMNSLLMALTAGTPIGANRLIPVFVDNDVKSKALTTSLDLIRYYRAEPKNDGKVGAHTLYTRMSAKATDWGSFFATEIAEPAILNKNGDNLGSLNTIIGSLKPEDPLQKAIEEEKDLLFTTDDLDMPLNVGFVGNPNIGSVVLNSVSLQEEGFTDILGHIGNDDGVIVIGSLFGGTGAAGVPLIINKFKDTEKVAANNRPILGVVAVLPYFAIAEKDQTNNLINTERWDVNSDTFDTKTRAALMYYDDSVKVDYMYYVGDGQNKALYPHFVGGEAQANPTHLAEVMAALSVVDFSKQPRPEHGEYKRPIWGFVNANGTASQVSNVSGIFNEDFRKAVVKFQLLEILFKENEFLKKYMAEHAPYTENIGFTPTMREAVYERGGWGKYACAWGLNNLFAAWNRWLKDLGKNDAKRCLVIFNASTAITRENVTSLFVTGREYGIAKTKKTKVGFGTIFGGGKEVTEAEKPTINQALLSAYRKLPAAEQTQEYALGLSDDQRLPKLLKIISDGLDIVMENNCNL